MLDGKKIISSATSYSTLKKNKIQGNSQYSYIEAKLFCAKFIKILIS